MPSLRSPLNNARLCEDPLPAEDYNRLPHIDSMHDAAAANAAAHATLLGIIAARGLGDTFSVHLVHRHFAVPEGRVMVYETVPGRPPSYADFLLCRPRKPAECGESLRGLYFRAVPGKGRGTMAAYEFTTAPGRDLSGHAGFVEEFAAAVLRLGVQDVFALTAAGICPPGAVLTELEMAHVLSTVLVADYPPWLPPRQAGAAASTTTDWLATKDYAKFAADGAVPGIVQLKCTKIRSSAHYNVTCSRVRDGAHLGHAAGPGPGPLSGASPGGQTTIVLDGVPLERGSEPYAIISRALEVVGST